MSVYKMFAFLFCLSVVVIVILTGLDYQVANNIDFIGFFNSLKIDNLNKDSYFNVTTALNGFNSSISEMQSIFSEFSDSNFFENVSNFFLLVASFFKLIFWLIMIFADYIVYFGLIVYNVLVWLFNQIMLT